MPALLAFVAGAATMVYELAAARVLAPAIGVSLPAWSAVIGVVLLGLALGGWGGGLLADRFGAPAALRLACIVGALGGLAIPPLAEWAPGTPLAHRDALTGIVWVAAATLFLPSLGMGAVVPAAVRSAIGDAVGTGGAVGRVYAATTAGSILGVYLTGFVLVDAVGSRRSVAFASAALLLCTFVLVWPWCRAWARVVGPALLAPFVAVALAPSWLSGPCTDESAYFCIQVVDDEATTGQRTRTLKLDRLVHGAISTDDPTALPRGYARVMADATSALFPTDAPLRALFVGGGAYVVPRYLEARYPGAQVDVVEIDPKVTRAAFEIGLRPDTRIRSHNVDARQFLLDRRPEAAYDVVYGDAFNDLSIPYHLTTRETAALLRRALTPDGLYLANVIDVFHGGRFLRSFVMTLRQVFPHVSLLLDAAALDQIRLPAGAVEPRRTFVVVASVHPVDLSRVEIAPGSTAALLPATELEAYLGGGGGIVLTDDHAPVDSLVAPLFLNRPL